MNEYEMNALSLSSHPSINIISIIPTSLPYLAYFPWLASVIMFLSFFFMNMATNDNGMLAFGGWL